MKYVETREIPLGEIQTNEYHLRDETKEKELDRLAASIEKLGLVHPIVVRFTPESPNAYALVAGERRFLAHQKLERPTIRADVWEATEEEAGEPDKFRRSAEMMTIVSNVQVEPLHLFEMGRRFLRWTTDFGMSDQDIADTLDISPTLVHEAITPIKSIAPAALELIEKNPDKIRRHHIDLLADEAPRTPPEGQVRIVQRIIEQDDKELVQRPSRLPQVARAVRRELRNEKRQRQAATAEPRPVHTDEFKRKKLFDFLEDAENALSSFKAAEIPESMSLIDLKSIEARGERLGRAWPQAVKDMLEEAERNAAARAASGQGDDGANQRDEERPTNVGQRARV